MDNHQVFSPVAPVLHILIDLLQLQVRDQPDHIDHTVLPDGEQRQAALTYAELNRRARAITGARPLVVLTTMAITSLAESLLAEDPDVGVLRWPVIETLAPDQSSVWSCRM